MSKYFSDVVRVARTLNATNSVKNATSAEPQMAILSELVAAMTVQAHLNSGSDVEALISEFERNTRLTIRDILARRRP